MVLNALRTPLVWTELPDQQPGPGEVRVKVGACGVCRTDLHVVDGELPNPHVPIIPGHEIVGRIDALGAGVEGLTLGERVGIPWLGHTCGTCPYCRLKRENLCDRPVFTGFTRDGGFATAAIADARFCFPLGESGSDESLAPLLCAGLIGWRSLTIAGEAGKLGLYGFGAAAQYFGTGGAVPGGVPSLPSPVRVTWQHSALRAPSGLSGPAVRMRCRPRNWTPPSSLRRREIWFRLRCGRFARGGRVVCAGIHMSDIPAFPYALLLGGAGAPVGRQSDAPRMGWISCVRCLRWPSLPARQLMLCRTPIRPWDDLRAGRFEGAAVLIPRNQDS